MYNMSLQLNDAYMFVLWAGGLKLQINLLPLSLSLAKICDVKWLTLKKILTSYFNR